MAFNPPLTSCGDPCRVEGEYFVMKRAGVEFEFNMTGGNKYSGKGYVSLIFIIIHLLGHTNNLPNGRRAKKSDWAFQII